MKITDYLLVKANDIKELQALVKENIEDWGWQPIGGVATLCEVYGGIAITENRVFFLQAMAKYGQ